MFNAIGDKDKLRARKVLKGWRIERIVPPNVLDPVWSLVQGWCDANVNRVLVAEGKRPLQAQAHQRQPLPQQRQHQEQQLRALLYHEQVRMGLKPLSQRAASDKPWAYPSAGKQLLHNNDSLPHVSNSSPCTSNNHRCSLQYNGMPTPSGPSACPCPRLCHH